MNKYTIGTIIGTALLSLIKKKSGGKSEEFDSDRIASNMIGYLDVFEEEDLRDIIESKYNVNQVTEIYTKFNAAKAQRNKKRKRLNSDRDNAIKAFKGELPYLGEGRNRKAYITPQGQVVKLPLSLTKQSQIDDYIGDKSSMDYLYNPFPRKPSDLDIGFPSRTYTHKDSTSHERRIDFEPKMQGETLVGNKEFLFKNKDSILAQRANDQLSKILENKYLILRPFQQAKKMANYKYAVDGNRGNFILQPDGEIKIIDANLNLSKKQVRTPEDLSFFNMGQVWESIFFEPTYMNISFNPEVVVEFKKLGNELLGQFNLYSYIGKDKLEAFNNWTGQPKGSAANTVGIMFEHRVLFGVTIRDWKMVQIITNNQDPTVSYSTEARYHHQRQYQGVVFKNPENPYIKELIVWTYSHYPNYRAIFDITFYSHEYEIKVTSGEDNKELNPEIWKMIRRTIPSLYDGSNNMTSWWKGLAVKNRPKVSNAFLDGPLKSIYNFPDRGRGVQTVSKQNKRRKKEYGRYYMELDNYGASFSVIDPPGTTVARDNKTSIGIPMKVKSNGSIVPFNFSKGYPKLRRR